MKKSILVLILATLLSACANNLNFVPTDSSDGRLDDESKGMSKASRK